MSGDRILITSPSLNPHENVSGIATLVRNIIKNSRFKISHFLVGSKDNQSKNSMWLFSQLYTFIKFTGLCVSKRFEVLHINTSMERLSILRDFIIVSIARVFGKKVLFHVHGGYYLMHRPQGRLLSFCMKKLFKYANIIVVLSERERGLLTQRFGELNFNVLPNAVDYDFNQQESYNTLNNNSQKIKLVFFGRINRSKGIYIMSEAFQQLGNYCKKLQLEIYGAGPELENWMCELERISDLQAEYKGVADNNVKWEALKRADVFLLPSIHSEGMPLAMLETMAAGGVVLVTDDASITTVVEDNVNGIVISKNSSSALAEKIKEILNGAIDLKKIGSNACEYVRRHLSFPQYISKLDKLYHEI